MYRRFRFEGAIHESLECVPLAVRRKLDLTGLKISLQGWQTLPRAERLALCHLSVDADAELLVYREILRGFCAACGVALSDLPHAASDASAWRVSDAPQLVVARCENIPLTFTTEVWSRLDEEERYAVVKLADPKKAIDKLCELLGELGLLAAPQVPVPIDRSVCIPRTAEAS